MFDKIIMWPLLVLLIILLFICEIPQTLRKLSKAQIARFRLNRLPDFPGREFFFGHSRQVLWISADEFFLKTRTLVKKSEDVAAVFTPLFGVVSIKHPKVVEAIISQPVNLEKADSYSFVRNWLGSGLLTCKGDIWQAKRKTLTPAFHFSILIEFVNIFNKHTRCFIENLEKHHLNESVDVVPLISDFTLAAVGETSMGSTINYESEEGKKYKNAIHEMAAIIYKRVLHPWLWFNFTFRLSGFGKRETSALQVLHNFTDNIIQTKSKEFKTFDYGLEDRIGKRKCPLMDLLLNGKFKHQGIDDAYIRDEVATFVFAGHDTSAMCLNYTMMLLACHKDIQEEVYQEILNYLGPDLSNEPTYTNLQDMNLLDRCIKESLRLYPPVPIIGRRMSVDTNTKYGTIPKNLDAFIQIFDIHRDPRFWPDPERFDPSRHLPEHVESRPAYAYIPFSAGPRNCIGQRFAMLEIKAFFCGLLRKFVLEPVDTPTTIVLTQEIILRPMNGIKLKFKIRSA